jgi:hypothetical protein
VGTTDWQALSPLLYDNGYSVFALNYGSYNGSGAIGVYGTGKIEDSAMPRYYLKFLNGAAKVHTLVGLAPSNHGTTLDGLFTLASFFPGANAAFVDCPACAEQQAGSAFMTNLNSGGDTVAGVDYTVIESATDEVVTPYQSAFLTGPKVTNITPQQQCTLDQGEHLSMA